MASLPTCIQEIGLGLIGVDAPKSAWPSTERDHALARPFPPALEHRAALGSVSFQLGHQDRRCLDGAVVAAELYRRGAGPRRPLGRDRRGGLRTRCTHATG